MSAIGLGEDPNVKVSVPPHTEEARPHRAGAQAPGLDAVLSCVTVEMGEWATVAGGRPSPASARRGLCAVIGRRRGGASAMGPSSRWNNSSSRTIGDTAQCVPKATIGAHLDVAGCTCSGDVVFPFGGGNRPVSVERLNDSTLTDDSNPPFLYRLLPTARQVAVLALRFGGGASERPA